MEGKIDRNNPEDILKQIGRVECSIANLNKKQGEIDKELGNWPRRMNHLYIQKYRIQKVISKKHLYINQLEKDLERTKQPNTEG